MTLVKPITVLAAIAILALAGCAPAPGDPAPGARTIDHTNFDPASLSDAEVAKAASLDVYFEHASVGLNILHGLETLSLASPRYTCGRVSWSYSNDPAWYDSNSGLGDNDRDNPASSVKISGFTASLTPTLAGKVSVAMYKFCYIDAPTVPGDGVKLFEAAKAAMESLQTTCPTVAFVWWTMPLETTSMLERQLFNDAVRSYCSANNQWLYDIADLESHDEPGAACVDVNGREILFSGYTTDGGHLPSSPYSSPVKDSPGSLKAAKAYWKLIAEIAKTR